MKISNKLFVSEAIQETHWIKLLIGSSGVMLAWVYLSTFLYQWFYFYNFGLARLAYAFNLESLQARFTILLIDLANRLNPYVGFLILLAFGLIAGFELRKRYAHNVLVLQKIRLTSDTSQSLLLGLVLAVGISMWVSLLHTMAWEKFRQDIDASRANTPIISGILQNEALPFLCEGTRNSIAYEGVITKGRDPLSPLALGNTGLFNQVIATQLCTGTANNSPPWRLLYENETSLYIYQPLRQALPGEAPRILILPHRPDLVILQEATHGGAY
jgi:hypothetical protein